MAKARKKTLTRKKTKRQNHASPFISVVKRLFIWISVVVACAIASLFVYDYLFPVKKTVPVSENRQEIPETPEKKITKAVPSGTSSKSFKLPVNAEIPRLQVKQKEQVVKHEGYTVSYNSDYRIANWVAYELTAAEAKSKKTNRSNKFVPDPMVKGASATNEDYTRTGYDRGHLAPAGDMKWSAKAMRESFYFSNICSQKPGLNRGIWKDLEEQCRLWAMDNRMLLIVTGPVISDDLKRMGKNKVAVPALFYKVICTIANNKPEGIAFLFENSDYRDISLESVAIPIDSVEKVTGIDFFPSFPDDHESRMEAGINWNVWSF